jgi:hypothetical protein
VNRDKGEPVQVDRLIAEVAARHGILLKRDDPAFALATIAQALLEATAARIERRFDARLTAFDAAVANAERRAGQMLADKIRRTPSLVPDAGPSESRRTIRAGENARVSLFNLASVFAIGVLIGAAATLCLVR